MTTTAHVALGDCERIRAGAVGQPVNTVSSLAYVVAGAWLARRRRGGVEGLVPLAAVAAGIGSVAYHGPGTPLGRRGHDVSALVLALVTGAHVVGRRSRIGVGRAVVGSAVLAVGGVVHAGTRTGRPWCRPDSRWQGHAAWHLLSATAVAVLADPG
jgi:hypothetical protein